MVLYVVVLPWKLRSADMFVQQVEKNTTMQTIDKKTTRREQGDSNNISTTTTTHHNEGTPMKAHAFFFWIKRSAEKHCRISHVESLFVLQNKTDSRQQAYIF